MSEQPAYGTERIVLLGGTTGFCTIRREVFTEDGFGGHFYDDDAKDFVTCRGAWHLVETLGTFGSKDAARAFMLAREQAA